MTAIDEILQRLLETNFSELPGLTVNASIPVPEALINELIRASLRGNKNISDCRVSVGSQNRMDVKVKIPMWPWPVDLKLKLFQSVDFSGSPKIRAFLESNVMLGKLGSSFKALPKGINIYEDQVSIDLGMFISKPEQKRILELIQEIQIRTEPGRLILDVKAER